MNEKEKKAHEKTTKKRLLELEIDLAFFEAELNDIVNRSHTSKEFSDCVRKINNINGKIFLLQNPVHKDMDTVMVTGINKNIVNK